MSKIAFMFPGQERRQPEWEKIFTNIARLREISLTDHPGF